MFLTHLTHSFFTWCIFYQIYLKYQISLSGASLLQMISFNKKWPSIYILWVLSWWKNREYFSPVHLSLNCHQRQVTKKLLVNNIFLKLISHWCKMNFHNFLRLNILVLLVVLCQFDSILGATVTGTSYFIFFLFLFLWKLAVLKSIRHSICFFNRLLIFLKIFPG